MYQSFKFSRLRFAAVCIITCAVAAPAARAGVPVVTSIHQFQAATAGANPQSSLVIGSDGAYYGTTPNGGIYNAGTVYRIGLDGAYLTIHNFTGEDGMNPTGRLLSYSDGNLYGTTEYGGTYNSGTVFKISTTGAMTSLYSFAAETANATGSLAIDAAYPTSGLILGKDGNFWGTSAFYDVYGLPTSAIYKVSKTGSEQVETFFYFNSPLDDIQGALVLAPDGFMYGTATGTSYPNGCVVRFDTYGDYKVVGSFTGANGSAPTGNMIVGSDAQLYGTTLTGGASGNGTIFQFTPGTGAISDVHSFSGGADGASPAAQVVQGQGSNTNLYGACQTGGANGSGTLFHLSLAGAITQIHSFSGAADGSTPTGGLLFGSDGTLYGTTMNGGGSANAGTVFHVAVNPATPNGGLTTLINFSQPGTDGRFDSSSLLIGTDGNYYGVTPAGGDNGGGTIFQFTPSGTYRVLYSFPNGAIPSGGLVELAGTFYGTTRTGSTGNGSVYSFTVTGDPSVLASITTLHAFQGYDGQYPQDTLCAASDGNLYGTTMLGGGNGVGEVYQITPTGTLTVLKSFDCKGADAYAPVAGLVQSPVDHLLYGVASLGGVNRRGVVFKIGFKPGSYAAVRQLDDSEGQSQSPLLISSQGDIFGLGQGGANDAGTVFEIPTKGATEPLINFTAATGEFPIGGLTPAPDGYLYGTTAFGGPTDTGAVYRFNPSGGGFADITFLDSALFGSNPMAALTVGSNGDLLGPTSVGGQYNLGAIIDVNPAVPSIAAFNPTSGKTGDQIVIVGDQFNTANAVTINGKPAAFSIVDDHTIDATVPNNAALTGAITVSTPVQTASLGTFTYYPFPKITGLSESSGNVGDSVVITGQNLNGASHVSFNQVQATFHENSDTQITATVPSGATTGRVRVTTPGGTATSTTVFTVAP